MANADGFQRKSELLHTFSATSSRSGYAPIGTQLKPLTRAQVEIMLAAGMTPVKIDANHPQLFLNSPFAGQRDCLGLG